MKTVSMREFQLNAPSLLDDLPIQLTKYGRVVAIIQPPEKDEKVQEVVKKIKTLKTSKLEADPTPLGMKKVEETFVDRNPYESGKCPHGYFNGCPYCGLKQ